MAVNHGKAIPTAVGTGMAPKFFKATSAPTDDTSTESPGSDLCFIIDTTNDKLYLVHDFVNSGDFTATELVMV